MMEALAELYWEQGKFAESTRVYKKVIAQNMDSPRICEWQNKIVRNTLSAGNKRTRSRRSSASAPSTTRSAR